MPISKATRGQLVYELTYMLEQLLINHIIKFLTSILWEYKNWSTKITVLLFSQERTRIGGKGANLLKFLLKKIIFNKAKINLDARQIRVELHCFKKLAPPLKLKSKPCPNNNLQPLFQIKTQPKQANSTIVKFTH